MDIKLEKGAVQICRICLQDVGLDYPILYLNCAGSENSSVTIKDKLIECVPELDLDTVPNAIICNECSIVLSSAYSFKLKCLRTEMQIKKYLQQMNATTLLDLTEVQHMDVVNRNIKVEEVSMPDFKMEVDEGSSNGSALVDAIHFKISTEDVLKDDCSANSDYTDMCEYVAESNSDLSLPVQTPADNGEIAKKTPEDLLPTKSRAIYDKEFQIFVNWKLRNAVKLVDETVMMTYFQELSEKYTPTSLWTKYSILKSTLIANDNVDISHYDRLVSFLKHRSKGYIPKKSKVLTADQVLAFMKDAPNDTYLLHKVVLVMGVFGGLRRDQMVRMTIDDIQDKGCVILVKVPETKTAEAKRFTIVEEDEIGALKLVRQYAALRPTGMHERRFFLTYRNKRCTVQPVGKNTVGSVPTIIAKFLKLENAKEYTGHCLRHTLKMRGKWKSTAVAESCYIGESLASKNHIARMIASSMDTTAEDANLCSTVDKFTAESNAESTEEAASTACTSLLPDKSKIRYKQTFDVFMKWCKTKNIVEITESVMLEYFVERSKVLKSPASLWCEYSMLKLTISQNKDQDISKFGKLKSFLRRKNDGFQPRKSKVFAVEDIEKFLIEAPDELYLMMKVVMIMGVAGACRTEELCKMKLRDIEFKGDVAVVRIREKKNSIRRSFVITNDLESTVDWLKIIQNYINLRPPNAVDERFFFRYERGRCVNQVVGKNTISKVPREIAKFLKLENIGEYTGLSFRRTSASFLAST